MIRSLSKVTFHMLRNICFSGNRSNKGETISQFPGFSGVVCKLLYNFPIYPVIKTFFIFKCFYLTQSLFAICGPVSRYVITPPFFWVFVAVRNQATVVPVFVDGFLAVVQANCFCFLLFDFIIKVIFILFLKSCLLK